MESNLELKGYSVEEVPTYKRPSAKYRHKDGRVVTLPADPYCLKYYLAKGLTLVAEEEKAPLYVSDKPAAPKKKRQKSKKGG